MLLRPRRALAFLLIVALAGLGRAQAVRHLHQAVSEVQLLVNTTVFDDGAWVEVILDCPSKSFAHAFRSMHRATSHAHVQVSWEGVQNPTNADAVALYFAGANPDVSSPLKFKWAATSESHLFTGTGSHRWGFLLGAGCPPLKSCVPLDHGIIWICWQCRFRLNNQRHDLAFLFFYNVSQSSGYSSANLLGRSVNLTLHTPNDPQHVHLALSRAEGYGRSSPMAHIP